MNPKHCIHRLSQIPIIVPIKTKIYGLYDECGLIKYVGKTVGTLKNRLNEHIRNALAGNRLHIDCGIRAMFRRGFSPTIDLFTEIEGSKWAVVEQLYIKHFRYLGYRLWNITDGGEGVPGHIHSAETRQKLRLCHIGQKCTEETKQKMSKSHRRYQTEETKKKLSRMKKGKPGSTKGMHYSERARKNMSDAAKGRVWTEEARQNNSESHKGLTPWNKGEHGLYKTSDETKKKISTKLKGKPFSNKHKTNLSLSAIGNKNAVKQVTS